MKRRSNAMEGSRGSNGHRELRSVSEEAERLGVSKGWLYNETREGRFPHVKLGGRVLLDPAKVDEFLAARSVGVEEALHQAEEDGVL